MLRRHDFVTPYVNGIRFFDKTAIALLDGVFLDGCLWNERLGRASTLAIAVLALLFATYALGIRLFAAVSPVSHPTAEVFYAALALATGIGPYLYTRFYIRTSCSPSG